MASDLVAPEGNWEACWSAGILTSLEGNPHTVLCFGLLKEPSQLVQEAASVNLDHMMQSQTSARLLLLGPE